MKHGHRRSCRHLFHPRQICIVLAALFMMAFELHSAGAGSATAPKISARDIKSLVAKNKGKVVLVNFWATWCPPCVEEFPDLVKVQNKYKAKGLQVIGVSMNDVTEKNELQAFLGKARPSFPIYLAASESDSFLKAIDKRWSGDIPLTIIYDKAGKVRYFHNEMSTYAQFEKDVKSLLAASRKQS